MEGYAASTSNPEDYLGQSINVLPTPAVIIDQFKVKSNIEQMAKTVSDWQCLFRAHIKTHKTKQGTALQLSAGKDRAIIVSTLAEAWGVVHSGLIEEGAVDDVSGSTAFFFSLFLSLSIVFLFTQVLFFLSRSCMVFRLGSIK